MVVTVPAGHKFCIICERVLPFVDAVWPKRWRAKPLSASNCQPRCRICDRGYRKRRNALTAAKKFMESVGLDPGALQRDDPYYRKLVLDATRWSGHDVHRVREAVLKPFEHDDPLRPTIETRRSTTTGHEETQRDI